jgi:hypothetical protein
LISGIFLIPLTYIWMRLLYQRNLAAYDGADLAARIAEWQQLHAAPVADGDLRAGDIPSTMPPQLAQAQHPKYNPGAIAEGS